MTLAPISPISPGSVSAADVFSAPVNLSGASQVTTAPQVSSNAAGNAVAVWLRATVIDNSDPTICDALDKCVVEVSQFNAGTGAWTAPETLSSATENATEADVIITNAGNAMAIWRRTSGVATVIQASFFDGNNWGAPTDLPNTTSGSPRGPQITVSGNLFTAVWYRTFSASQNFVESKQYNGSWSALRIISLETDENAVVSRVVADDSGNAVAVWQGQLSGGSFFVRASRFSGGVWGAPVSVSSAATLGVDETLAPQVAIDAAGNATAVWHQTDGTNPLIYTSRYNVGTGVWSPPVPISVPGNRAFNAMSSRTRLAM